VENMEAVVEFEVSGGVPSLDAFGGSRTIPGGFMLITSSALNSWLRLYWELHGFPLIRSWTKISKLSTRKSASKDFSDISFELEKGMQNVDALFGFPLKSRKRAHKNFSWVFGPLQTSFAVSKNPVDVDLVKVTAAFKSEKERKMRSFGNRYTVWFTRFIAYVRFVPNTWSSDIWSMYFNGAGKYLKEKRMIRQVSVEGVWEFILESLKGAITTRNSSMVKITALDIKVREYRGPIELWEILGGEGI